MADLKITLEEINKLMEKLSVLNLGGLKIEQEDFKLEISAKETQLVQSVSSAQVQTTSQTAQSITDTMQNCIPISSDKPNGNIMKSPIVGTFYESVSPDKPPFVSVGSKVKKGDILFVIESMKLMNEIQSDFDGEITEILVKNAQGVEYNQPVMVISN